MRERLAKRRANRAKQEELEREEAKNLRPKSAVDVFGKVMQMIPVSALQNEAVYSGKTYVDISMFGLFYTLYLVQSYKPNFG